MTKTLTVRLTHYKTALMLAAAVLMSLVFVPMMASAATTTVDNNYGLDYGDQLGLGDRSLDDAVIGLINVLLGFLGLIAVIIILIGGFRWMTAGGNEDKVGEARKTIFAGIIGLAIILFAWGITTFVLTQLGNASGADISAGNSL